MKVQDLEHTPSALSRAQFLRSVVVYAAILGAVLAAAVIGSDRSERAHRALEWQYQQCELSHGFGTPAFRRCIH